MAGRWKAQNDGSAYYDANDSGPDQVQGMGGAPSQGPTGSGNAQAGAAAQDGSQPGWGPIKISGSYQPHPQSPGDFWSHMGQMPAQGQGGQPNGGQPGQGQGGDPSTQATDQGPYGQGPLPNPGGGGVWNDYKGQGGDLNGPGGVWNNPQLPGGHTPGFGELPPIVGFPGGRHGPYDHDWNPRGPDGAPLPMDIQRIPQVDPSRYDPNLSYGDYNRDYHAPDRNEVLRDMPGRPMQHLMNGGGMSSPETQGGSSDLLKQLLQRAQQQKQQGGGGGILSLLGGAGGGLI